MEIFRVQKNENYTVMSNYHFQEKDMSLRAKGLLSLILSLPDDWDLTVKGLAALSKDGVDAVRKTIKELETFGYMDKKDVRDDGKFKTIYTVYEIPCRLGFTDTVLPIRQNRYGFTDTVNPTQLNTKDKILKQNTKDKVLKREGGGKAATTRARHRYGRYRNVLLSDEDIAKLKDEFPGDWEDRIERVSEYCASVGKSYKNYLATIRNWDRRDKDRKREKTQDDDYADTLAREKMLDESLQADVDAIWAEAERQT